MRQIKICGITTPEMLQVAEDAGADFIGLVFAENSVRALSIEAAKTLLQSAQKKAKIVALVVDAADDFLRLIATLPLDYVQLHGEESVERAAEIRQKFPQWKIIKAVGVATPADIEKANRYQHVADWLLLDAKPLENQPKGGNNHVFDWGLLKNWHSPLPWFLAGGLNSDNVAAALRETGAVAVDVSSGVESTRGVKDAALIKQFIRAARND